MRPRRRSAALLLALGLGLPGDVRAQAPTAPAPDGGDQAPEAAVRNLAPDLQGAHLGDGGPLERGLLERG